MDLRHYFQEIKRMQCFHKMLQIHKCCKWVISAHWLVVVGQHDDVIICTLFEPLRAKDVPVY